MHRFNERGQPYTTALWQEMKSKGSNTHIGHRDLPGTNHLISYNLTTHRSITDGN